MFLYDSINKEKFVLARLHKLAKETNKQIQDMGLTYNITEDYLYQEGISKGREEEKRGLIINMLKVKTLSKEKITELAEVSLEYVKQLEKVLKK